MLLAKAPSRACYSCDPGRTGRESVNSCNSACSWAECRKRKSVSLAEEVLYRKPKGMRIADNRSGLRGGKVALFGTGEVHQLARFGGGSVAGYEGDFVAPYIKVAV
jgi:hypothetical protein